MSYLSCLVLFAVSVAATFIVIILTIIRTQGIVTVVVAIAVPIVRGLETLLVVLPIVVLIC